MNNLLQKSIEKQGPQQSADAQNPSQNTVSDAYAAKVRKSKRRPKNRQKRQKNVEKTAPKHVEKTGRGRPQKTPKIDAKWYSRGSWGLPGTTESSIFGVPAGAPKIIEKKDRQKIVFLAFFGVLV